jgi:hypothetical protein
MNLWWDDTQLFSYFVFIDKTIIYRYSKIKNLIKIRYDIKRP